MTLHEVKLVRLQEQAETFLLLLMKKETEAVVSFS